MKMLSSAVASKLDNYVAPKCGEGFEDLCLDIFEHVLSKRGFPIIGGPYARMVAHGVSGDSQEGVDIYDPATMAAAQCKNHAGLKPSHLEGELQKLKKFGRPVSHYFFMLGRDGVPKTLQKWENEANQRSADAHSDESNAVIDSGEVCPMLHIMGWREIKTYLFKSNFLMWKWGVAHPVIHQYPYLPTLDVGFLAETMDALENSLDVLPNRRDSRDAVEGLLRSVNIDGLVNLVADGKVEWKVFAGLDYFIETFQQVLGVHRTYAVAVKDVDSQDPIIMEQGFALMNDLARHLPRISVLGYLRTVYRATRKLLKIFGDEESYIWEPVTVEHQGEEIEVDGDTTLLFNFDQEDCSHPYYVDPKEVDSLVRAIVEGVRRARQEAAEF
ncbi:hypothetical protein [Pseudomonas syringae]|uniref:hypothetical protein n=1 Tax=Pseudomonas syringae TaxID=317 RepID=UPI0002A7B373|nr:hypothetical protein [Pseudomonas syringae]ELQ01679.1 hypothetical protein A987_13015 [Pseudomonas syringae BRIP34881]ELQ04636.1 hypothetical protein A979_01554 [Pseudomonas syringae BRIP34876]